ncbi:MAG: hypothetical protein IPH82_10890 [Chloroflexi bacterium]|nr:hypothetical protein [Chloroflexota bacterium]
MENSTLTIKKHAEIWTKDGQRLGEATHVYHRLEGVNPAELHYAAYLEIFLLRLASIILYRRILSPGMMQLTAVSPSLPRVKPSKTAPGIVCPASSPWAKPAKKTCPPDSSIGAVDGRLHTAVRSGCLSPQPTKICNTLVCRYVTMSL